MLSHMFRVKIKNETVCFDPTFFAQQILWDK